MLTDVWNIVITLALPIPASIAKYAIRSNGAAISPSDFTVRFFDVNNLQVVIDNQFTEVFTVGQTKEFTAAANGVTKATLTINRIATISRGTSAYFVNSAGRLELAAANVPRFAFNPVTLAAEGLMIEQARTNVFSNTNNMMNGDWIRVGDTLTTLADFLLYAAGGSVYYLKGDGSWNSHQVFRMFNAQFSSTRTISVYLRQHTTVWAQIASSTAFIVFANFNLSNGTLGPRGGGASSSAITPAPDG